MDMDRQEPRRLDFRFTAIIDDQKTQELERLQQEAAQKAKDQAQLDWFFKNSKVPTRYLESSLNNYTPYTALQNKALDICTDFATHPEDRTLILCGPNGTGKTHLAAGILRKVKGLYVTLLEILYRLDSAKAFHSADTKMQVLELYCKTPLLVIDEVGRGETAGQKDRQAEILYYLLNTRYGACLPTVICTNMGKVDLVRYMGEAVRDRLNETCIFCELDGESQRGRHRQEVQGSGN
jgi:DNA replication protein DnaC